MPNDQELGPYYPMDTILKDPNAVLPYEFDWTEWLGSGVEITSHTIIAETGITAVSSEIVMPGSLKVRVWLSGGTVGELYNVVCRVTTDEATPRIDDRTIIIQIEER